MVRVWRLALIWLMVAVLPFKAVAGVTMVGCGPQHEAAHAIVVEQPRVTHHGHGAHHDHAARHAPADLKSTAVSVDATAAEAGVAKVKCGSCAPCCAAAAPAFAAHALPNAAATGTVTSLVADSFAGVVTDVPHRPPRPILA